MEITEMTLTDLEQMKNTLYSDFDNFWSYNVLKQELENENTTYIKTHFPNIRNLNIYIFKFNQIIFTTIHVVKYENISMRHICPMLIIIN